MTEFKEDIELFHIKLNGIEKQLQRIEDILNKIHCPDNIPKVMKKTCPIRKKVIE